MTCPYLPLPLPEQERLREQARANRLQRAVLQPHSIDRRTARGVYATQILMDPGQRIQEMLPEDKPADYTWTGSNAASHGNVDSQAVSSSEVQVTTKANKTAGDNTRAGRIGAPCAILSLLPLVMAVIQDVMSGKRTRTQAEDDTEEIPGEPANKTPRNRHTVAESLDDGHEFDQDEELLDRVFVRPRTARVRGPEENTVTGGNRMRAPMNCSEERLPMARDLATENNEASPTNLVDPLTPETTDTNEDRREQ